MRARRSHLVLLGLILAALAGVALLAIPGSPGHKSPTLGLDLQGGLEVVLEAVPPKGRKLTAEDLDRSVNVMRERIDKLGVREPEVRKQGSNQIVIQLAGVHDPKQAAELIGKTAQLELYDLQSDLTGPSIVVRGLQREPRETPTLYALLTGVKQQAKKGTPEAYYLFQGRRRAGGPFQTGEQLEQARKKLIAAGRQPKTLTTLAVPAKTVVTTCTPTNENPCPGNTIPGRTYFYLFKHDVTNPDEDKRVPQMTGADIKADGTVQDFDQLGQAIVRIAFTGKGDRKFQQITRRLWQRGRLVGVSQQFAIVLDNEIKSFPQIDHEDRTLSNGISGGAQIENIGTIREAKDLALVLQTGALPVSFKQADRTDVSATLGKDSLRQAWQAAIAGLIIVAFFLLLFYRFLGLVAVIGLGIYAALLYATLLVFDVTLTLPGFAGMILTIGVAADANIVIFERIKEEFRAGKSVRAAIAAGYQKGFSTIVDANVVTVISALVIFAVATAGVKGFALMLLIGTAISLITAVAATRAILGMLAGFKWFDNPAFMGASAEQVPAWQKIDFVGRRRLWFSLSGIGIALAVVSLAVNGLNLGIDFRGGSAINFQTPTPIAVDDVRNELKAIGRGGDQIQGRGQTTNGGFRNFGIRTESLSGEEQNRLASSLEAKFDARVTSVRNVSESFSGQILRGAIYAIAVSFFLIALYVSLRFEWRFSVPILRTLVNDVLITVGVYSFSGREVNAATVAAFLTILGYSIYDTIIIFDRVRENLHLMRRASFAMIANQSLWETVRRSLATTIITLLPVGTIFFFGGDTLKDFAFAILIGIGVSAFSTVFIATPFLVVLKEREPEFRRRIGAEVVEAGVGRVAPASVAKEEEQAATAAEPSPQLVAPATGDGSQSQSKRERRRQRRRTRPHGRAR